jgi:hypothetical protein
MSNVRRLYALDKYTDFITSHNGKKINLLAELKKAEISQSVTPWKNAKVAQRLGPGIYAILSNDPKKDAARVLTKSNQMRDEYERKKHKKENKPNLFEQPKPQNKPEPKPEKPTRRKRISILWGLVTIEQ